MAVSNTGPVAISSRAVYLAQIFYGITVPLFALATAIFGFRMWRIRAQAGINRASDICMVVGFALAITDWALVMPQMFLTAGPKPVEVTKNAIKYAFLAIPIWGLSMAMIKTSIGLTLLKIQTASWFQILIWANITISCLYGFVNVFFILFECRPLPAAWGDYTEEDAECLPYSAIQTASYVGCGISMVTDIVLSLAPMTFLWNLNRPVREKILVGVLMALGLVAAFSSLAKNLIIRSSYTDVWAGTIAICTWTTLEQNLGIIAANAPFCKPIMQRCLGCIGIYETKAGSSTKYGQWRLSSQTAVSRNAPARTSGICDSDEDPLAINLGDIEQSSGYVNMQKPGVVVKRTDILISSQPRRQGDQAVAANSAWTSERSRTEQVSAHENSPKESDM